jgi:hypothetical protein
VSPPAGRELRARRAPLPCAVSARVDGHSGAR